jgi:hypothetical protein
MSRILKIDNFERDFPTKYGLDADGSCYEVSSPFDIMIIVDYESISGDPKEMYKKPKWEKIQANEGDFIVCNKNGTFIIPKDSDGFIECCPVKTSKQQDLDFDTFPKNSLEKKGKELFKVHSIPFKERQQMITFNLI